MIDFKEYPLHQLGGAFFSMTTIEDADEYFFDGMHRHDFYELLWFTDIGPEQAHYIDFNKCTIDPNQVFLLLPGQVHSIEQRHKRGFLMAISKDFFEKLLGGDIFWFQEYSSNFTIVVPDDSLHIFNTLMKLIRLEYDGNRRPAILESYLRSWFLHCVEIKKQLSPATHSNPRIQILIESIENHYRKQRNADFYAAQLSISAKRLNEITREFFGKTISQMINDRLILEAKREMGNVEKPIKEISYALGFSEPAYFTRFFGKHTGCAPQDFRKRIASPE
jgi:AraC family transcriptional activator of pobA